MGDENSIDLRELYEDRLLVLIEDNTKGIFRQVLLSPKQFKRVSDAIIVESHGVDNENGEPIETVEINIGDTEYPGDMFIGCSSIEHVS
jgi:hypothetical protein